jgi:hypothetical protein
MEFLQAQVFVRQGELGLIGASLGGIIALAGNGYPEVLTSVSLSAPTFSTHAFFPEEPHRSAYFLAGELDKNESLDMDFARDAQQMYDGCLEPRKLTLIPRTPLHGTKLLDIDSLNTSICDWITATLPH